MSGEMSCALLAKEQTTKITKIISNFIIMVNLASQIKITNNTKVDHMYAKQLFSEHMVAENFKMIYTD